MSTHRHSFRAIPGAGWKCTGCARHTVTPPPTELRASYQERLAAERSRATAEFIAAEVAAGRACGDHDRPIPCTECAS